MRSSSKKHREISALYREWATQNALPQLLRIHLVAVGFAVFLTITDLYLWGPQSSWFRTFRLGLIAIIAINVIVLLLVKSHHQHWVRESVAYGISFVTAACWHTMYLYFLLEAPSISRGIVIAAIYMTIAIIHYVYRQFWKLHYATAVFLAISMVLTAQLNLALRLDSLSLFIWNAALTLIGWAQRRNFCDSLYLRFQDLKKQLPTKVARLICMESAGITVADAFKPRMRLCSCICMDWRGFQSFAASNPAEVVANRIQVVHDEVMAMIHESVPSESFFADWSADEIFVTIYSDTDDSQEVLQSTVEFCRRFRSDIRSRLISKIGQDLPVIDVGVAMGLGLLGLVGPTNMKKTTIVGAVGGIAKRLESAAKIIRSEEACSPEPIICTTAEVFLFTRSTHPDFAVTWRQVTKNIKDLEGKSIFALWDDLGAVSTKALPKAGGF